MARFLGRDEKESLGMELAELGRSIGSSFHHHASSFRSSISDASSYKEKDDEVDQKQWAAIERLPTFERVRTSLFDHHSLNDGKEELGKRVIDVTKMGALERHVFMEKLLKKIQEDNHQLLQKLRERMDRVGLEFPTVEVRYQNLSVEAECEVVHGEPIPTLWNALKSTFYAITNFTRCKSQANKIKILKDVSGVIKPSRMTLLLGPPGCGKTTLLMALAGTLDQPLKVAGEITYNGCNLDNFVPQKTSAYISQYDLHIPEMSVRETLDFSACCQGIGCRAEIIKELSRREKQAGITPEVDIDTYMKAISVNGLETSLQTDYILKILGLDICADTIVGDAMRSGISGGQKKRLTTGEMIIGPTKALFMDEISTGLDSSTTFQIVTYLQQLTHITKSTVLVSLLQPAPETFDLFDDIILMAQGKIVYHGPRNCILDFFEHCGFRRPPRKGVADFLQEVVSRRDQAQYWHHKDQPYSYVSVDIFESIFKEFPVGQKLAEELSMPSDTSESQKNALSFNAYSLGKWELFKACMAREWLLMKRNSFIHVFKSAQLVVIALITMTIFIRSQMTVDVFHSNYYMSSLFYAIIRLMSNEVSELALTVSRLPVLYKQRDLYFYPAWSYSIPAAILKIPFSFLDAFLWTALTYYIIGYSPEPERFFGQFLILFHLHLVSTSIFRLIASTFRNPSNAASCSLFSFLVMMLFGGFLIPKSSLPAWLAWCFWLSPLTYAQIGASVNEFHALRWQKVLSSNVTMGQQVLRSHGLDFNGYFYWISVGALLGFWIVFNIGFTFTLSYLKSPGRSRTIIFHQQFSHLKGKRKKLPHVGASRSVAERKMTGRTILIMASITGMVLPCEPITLSFENVQYFVNTPKKLRMQGFAPQRLQLLQDISGAFRPGVLTALMGVSGAGKTTLLDVLSGRKTGGMTEGEIRIGGYPEVQDTYARISAYCEQTDLHSPQITIEESVTYSAWLRLPSEIDRYTKSEFVAEVLQMIELDEIKHALVGTPGTSGISNEQRKRLTIAVGLVSNPSIIFMDEPTSGLDARAAAIIMRVVKSIVTTRRTVVCTIHQPSIDIFETFDELILMKRGGQIIYSGELGQQSSELIKYFEGISGVPKFKENHNPAMWMLEVTSPSAEAELGVDFAHLYKESHLYRENKELVRKLRLPSQGSEELKFSTRFPQNGWQQFKACLWKQHISYWRSPQYNLGRLSFITMASLLCAALLWQKGQKMDVEQDLINIVGSMFIFLLVLGLCNSSTVLPFIVTERTILYRERFAGMYSSWAYSSAQVTVEIPYIFLQALLFVTITYPAINFYWSPYKMIWYSYTVFSTLLYFNYLGMMFVSLTPTFQVASVLAGFSYTMLNLFAGFIIPEPKIPKWWVWGYWIYPTAWSLKALITSQYGDISKEISVLGEPKAINAFLKSYYGYNHDDLGVIAIVLISFPLVFASVFGYTIAKLNFQRR